MKLRLLALILLSVLVITFTPAAWAVDNAGGVVREARTNQEIEQQKQELQERKEELQVKLDKAQENLRANQARKCEFLKTRLEFQRDKAAEIREHRKKRYQNIVDRLNALADRMDNNGLDSTELRAKIAELTALVSTYADTYTGYETALQTAINAACDGDEVSKDTVKTARDLLARLRSNAESIHTFFQDKVKPMLRDIQELVKESGE